jgi:hypothetical protein
MQGPFPIRGSDNTKYNVKFIDKKSGYFFMSTLVNREAADAGPSSFMNNPGSLVLWWKPSSKSVALTHTSG